MNASEELSTELTIHDLKNINLIISTYRERIPMLEKDLKVVQALQEKIETFLSNIK
jgi:hypothetical protein